jgi:hypothetical protein
LEAFEAENWGGKVFLTATGGSFLSVLTSYVPEAWALVVDSSDVLHGVSGLMIRN